MGKVCAAASVTAPRIPAQTMTVPSRQPMSLGAEVVDIGDALAPGFSELARSFSASVASSSPAMRRFRR